MEAPIVKAPLTGLSLQFHTLQTRHKCRAYYHLFVSALLTSLKPLHVSGSQPSTLRFLASLIC